MTAKTLAGRLHRLGWSEPELVEAMTQCGVSESRARAIVDGYDSGLSLKRAELQLLHELLDVLEMVEVPLEVSDPSGPPPSELSGREPMRMAL